jgi:hypothetical protein
MKSEIIIMVSLAMDFTLFSPSYAVRGLMGGKTSDPVAMPAGSIRDHVDVSVCHSIISRGLPRQ